MSSVQFVRGVVTENDDPELLGRVKVRYRWQGNATGASKWAPVLRDFAHTGGGGDWYLPDVNDEVLLVFERGERTSPIVMGAYFSDPASEWAPVLQDFTRSDGGGQCSPIDMGADFSGPVPVAKSGRKGDGNKDKKNSLYFSKTNGGLLFAFDDTEGNRTIELKDAEDHEFSVASDKKEVRVKDSSGNTLELLGKEKTTRLKHGSGHALTMKEKATELRHATGHVVSLKDGEIAIKDTNGNDFKVGAGSIKIKSAKKISVDSPEVSVGGKGSILLGKGAAEGLLTGNPLLMQTFNMHTHGLSLPPAVLMTPTMFSPKVFQGGAMPTVPSAPKKGH